MKDQHLTQALVDTGVYDTKQINKVLVDGFKTYGLEYILNRSVPLINDGLKPVHRRILYDMRYMLKVPENTGNSLKTTTKKSATIVGDIIGRLHPHGDQAVYEAYIGLAQPWNQPYPLIHVHGSKGTIDGDPAAAQRYTEGCLTYYGEELVRTLKEIDDDPDLFKETELQDGNKEPKFFPTLLPNLLVNGSFGISIKPTKLPPFNFNEVIDLCCKYASGKNIDNDVLYPDFGTCGAFTKPLMVYADKQEWQNIMHVGRGSFTIYSEIQAVYDQNKHQETLEVKNFPYGVSTSKINNNLADFLDPDKKQFSPEIIDIVDLSGKQNDHKNKVIPIQQPLGYHDEEQRNDIRIVLQLKKGANKQKIIQKLYKYGGLKTTYAVSANIVDQQHVHAWGVTEIVKVTVNNGLAILVLIYQKQIKVAKSKIELDEGLIKLQTCIEDVIQMVQKTHSRDEVVNKLQKKFGFTVNQANYIADLKLHKLNKDETDKWKAEVKDLTAKIKNWEQIINNHELLVKEYVAKMQAYKTQFGRPRFTTVLDHDLEGDVNNASVEQDIQPNALVFHQDGLVEEVKVDPTKFNTNTKTTWTVPNNIDLVLIASNGKYYNWVAGTVESDLTTIFKEKMKLVAVVPYNDQQSVLTFTVNKVKKTKLSDVHDRIKPGQLMDLGKEKLLSLAVIDNDNLFIECYGANKGQKACLCFSVSEVPFQVNGTGVALAGNQVETVKVVAKSKLPIRHRGAVLKKI